MASNYLDKFFSPDKNTQKVLKKYFFSYDYKVSIYDITVDIMTKNDEVFLRCSKITQDDERCRKLCHKNCLGCTRANSNTSCVKCRYSGKYLDQNYLKCFDSCPIGFVKSQDLNECIG